MAGLLEEAFKRNCGFQSEPFYRVHVVGAFFLVRGHVVLGIRLLA